MCAIRQRRARLTACIPPSLNNGMQLTTLRTTADAGAVMEDDKPVYPIKIGLLCTMAEMTCTNHFHDMAYSLFLPDKTLYICNNADIGSRVYDL